MIPPHLQLDWMRTISEEVRRLGGPRSLGGRVDTEQRWSGYWITNDAGMALARIYVDDDAVRVDHYPGDAVIAVLERAVFRDT